MKSIKKMVISFGIALLVVVIVQFVWNKFNKNNITVYVAVCDIYKGEKISKDDVKEINVERNSDISKYTSVKIENKIAKENIVAGKILESSDITSKEVDDIEEEYEYLTIELDNVSDSLAYQLKKDDYINIYYTTKNKKLDSVLLNRSEVIETELNTTFRIFENIKVIGLYDSVGMEVNSGEQYKAIMLRVKKDEAMLVSNIKEEGTFTVSIVK